MRTLLPGKQRAETERLKDELRQKEAAISNLKSALQEQKTKVDRFRRSDRTLRGKLRGAVETITKTAPAYKHYESVFSYADAVAEVTAGRRVDVCFVHESLTLEAARSVLERSECPLIFDAVEHPDLSTRSIADEEQVRNCRKTRLLQMGLDEVARRASLVTTTSPALADLYEEKGLRRPVVVRNCRRYQPAVSDRRIREDCGIGDDATLILYPNDVQKREFLELALSALSRLPEHVHLALMGKPFIEVAEAAPALIETYGVGNRLHVLERRPPNDLIGYRSGADMALIVLDPENRNHVTSLPNRLFEVIMSRLPVASTGLPCIKETIETFGCGKVFDNDPQQLASICEQMLEDARYKHAVVAAAEQLTWENERQVFEEAIRPVLPPAGGNVLFLANKKIGVNDRCARHVDSLVQLGNRVQVVARDEPHESLRNGAVEYTAVDL